MNFETSRIPSLASKTYKDHSHIAKGREHTRPEIRIQKNGTEETYAMNQCPRQPTQEEAKIRIQYISKRPGLIVVTA